MLPEDDMVRLKHMLDVAREAMSYVEGQTREDLSQDPRTGRALIACLMILGEAANGVSRDTQGDHPEIEWPAIIGMRHRLIHVYYDIDFDVVWKTTQEDLPVLIPQLERLLPDALP
jgi:uncharacterized protein with HEPN domain